MPGPPGVAVLGSAAEVWPVPDCGCVACRTATAVRAPSALRVGDVVVAGGHVVTPDARRRPLLAGERSEAGGVRVAALPGAAGAAPVVVVGWDDGRTMLWAEGPGELPPATLDALAGAGLDAVALDVRGGAGDHDPRHLAWTLARLRAVDAVAPGADVVAIGLSHDQHPGVLAERLGRWGVRIAADGSVLARPAVSPSGVSPSGVGRAPALRTLVLGPASSGKSAVAEDLLLAEPSVLYVATGPVPGPDDAGWAARVGEHRGRRPRWWSTHETADRTGDLAGLLGAPGPPLLVDALGTWVAAVMDGAGAWDDSPGWRDRVEQEVRRVVATWRQTRRRVVAVGEEVGWGVVPADRGTAAFREVLGDLSQRLAAQSERVLLVVAGRVLEPGPRR